MPDRNPLRGFGNLSPNQQVAYGCLIIILIGTATLYCVGTFAMVMRPSLATRPPTPTQVILPTLVPTLTPVAPTFINLPKGTLISTPTQAPIPTREPPTLTPTVDLTNPAPTLSVTTTITVTRTPTRRVTSTVTVRP
ncbi:MAG: hypothetical protein HZB51_08395 [Chloroflexi bacterium]|nr:hypothetical protein [Chloroflexota bacterium]